MIKAKKTKISRRHQNAAGKNNGLLKSKSKVTVVDRRKGKSRKQPAVKASLAAESKTRNRNPTKNISLLGLIIYGVTIVIGLSTILGTTISIASSFKSPIPEPKADVADVQPDSDNQVKLQQILTTAALGQEIKPLKTKLETLAEKYPDLEPEIFLVDLDTKGYVSIRGKQKIASASTIKLPILVAFLQDVDRGKINLQEKLTMTEEKIAEGSGNMQYQEPGTQFTALETADKMITISDNTATNMLIDRLGGMEVLNKRFIAMGLTETQLSNPLPDLSGTNTTSPEDLGNLLLKINSGKLLTLRSRDRLLHIMGNVERNTLLPQGLESEALIAHKTGDIKSVLADVGTIDMPNGKRYIVSMLIKRPDNSPQAQEFIQKASGIVYQYFKNTQTSSFTLEDNQ